MAKAFDPIALLKKPVGDIKPPVPMPLGSYVAAIKDYEFDKTKPKDGKEPTQLVRVEPILIEAFPDVDSSAVAEWLDGKQMAEIEQRSLDFFLTEKAIYRLKELLYDHCGLSEEEVPNLAEALEIGKEKHLQFGVEVGAVPNTREPSKPYHQIVRTFALPTD